MGVDTIVDIAQEAIFTMLLVVTPVMVAGFVVGLLMSFLQAIFQIHEYTFAFVPKLVAIMASLIIYAPWMLNKLMAFSRQFFGNYEKYLQ